MQLLCQNVLTNVSYHTNFCRLCKFVGCLKLLFSSLQILYSPKCNVQFTRTSVMSKRRLCCGNPQDETVYKTQVSFLLPNLERCNVTNDLFRVPRSQENQFTLWAFSISQVLMLRRANADNLVSFCGAMWRISSLVCEYKECLTCSWNPFFNNWCGYECIQAGKKE